TVEATRLPVFHEILAAGFHVPAPAGVSIRKVLTTYIGLDARYLEARVQTIFLNGRVVDDFDQTKIKAGDVLALSSAMPGLVGAVFRKESPLSKMRGLAISETETAAAETENPGGIILKLFNQVARDLGPDFLAAGIRVSAAYLRRFLVAHPELVLKGVRAGGKELEAEELPAVLNVSADVRVRIHSA
ncbi:MAG: hypothetical protein ACLFRF_04780, partial [Desulfobacterales bacterium]